MTAAPPLLTLFEDLRTAGLPLDIHHLRDLLRAMEEGFGIADLDDFGRLCRRLWVSDRTAGAVFDHHFAGFRRNCGEDAAPGAVPLRQPGSGTAGPEPDRAAGAAPESRPGPPAAAGAGAAFMIEAVTAPDAIEAVTSIGIPLDRRDYLPVSRRAMKRHWRGLRRMVRQGAPVEPDVDATLERLARTGILAEPVMAARRTNQSDLLLLIDTQGSMVPFHDLARRLADTAVRGGLLRRVTVRHFHDVPEAVVFHDPGLHQPVELADALAAVDPRHGHVLIVGDAGAARGLRSGARIEATRRFLADLRRRTARVAWLNPMPCPRWRGTSAQAIAVAVPMFEFSPAGLHGTLAALRGRSTTGQGRTR